MPTNLTARLAEAALLLAAIALFMATLLFTRGRGYTDRAIRDFARDQATQVDLRSKGRSIDTCNRLNPSRAYNRLRADEFTLTSHQGSSYTTRISPWVFSILDCEKTVLATSVQEQYLKIFRHKRVPVVQHGLIVGSIPFATYFVQHD